MGLGNPKLAAMDGRESMILAGLFVMAWFVFRLEYKGRERALKTESTKTTVLIFLFDDPLRLWAAPSL